MIDSHFSLDMSTYLHSTQYIINVFDQFNDPLANQTSVKQTYIHTGQFKRKLILQKMENTPSFLLFLYSSPILEFSCSSFYQVTRVRIPEELEFFPFCIGGPLIPHLEKLSNYFNGQRPVATLQANMEGDDYNNKVSQCCATLKTVTSKTHLFKYYILHKTLQCRYTLTGRINRPLARFTFNPVYFSSD